MLVTPTIEDLSNILKSLAIDCPPRVSRRRPLAGGWPGLFGVIVLLLFLNGNAGIVTKNLRMQLT